MEKEDMLLSSLGIKNFRSSDNEGIYLGINHISLYINCGYDLKILVNLRLT
jgi:hypothetical protein